MRVLIDPGHGGRDSGAVSQDGKTLEKDIVLKVGARVYELLALYSGQPYLSRNHDVFLTLSERAEKANKLDSDLLSIHCNAGGGRGFEVFTSPGQTRSDPWATLILEELSDSFPERPVRTDVRDGDPDKEARFTVLTKTRRAAVLVELGFIDTVLGEAFLTDSLNQENLARAIARATLRFNGIRVGRKFAKVTSPEETDDRNEEAVAEDALTFEDRLAKLEERVSKLENQT
jgi:N-acetylmuramoyl-L-alanine amidase